MATVTLKEGWLDNHPLLQQIVKISQARQIEIYLVGGAVRDLLLGRENIVDLDFAVPGDGLAVARQVANALQVAFYPLDVERQTGRVVYDTPNTTGPKKSYLDFATFRGPSLLADLADRDFTVNAMALNLAEPAELIDPQNGQRDLQSGQIQAVTNDAFENDPARVLRAIRQAAEFGFSIETKTRQLARQAAPKLATVSPERQRDEILKLLNTPAPGQAVEELHQLGILPHILPEVETLIGVEQSPPHYLDVFDHTIAALTTWTKMRQVDFSDPPIRLPAAVKQYLHEPLAGNVTLEMIMPVAQLLHDTGKPATRTVKIQESGHYTKTQFLGHERESAKIARQVMNRFHFSGQAIGFVETVVTQHMRPLLLAQEGTASRRAIYRLFRDTTGQNYQAGVAVALHALADQRATYPPGQGQAEEKALLEITNKLITAFFEQREQVVDPPPILNGRDLMAELNLAQGQLIGQLLDRLREAQATGQVQTRLQALNFIKTDPEFLKHKEEN
ncbi:MAG: CCA tRNA nucleotidyltransferase [Anaerolineae bacterium]|nr:CCA tRNA nucleotidyltransferase [Anaerolineae bacterium]